MRKTGQPPRNIAMAAPERMECVPTSVGAMWRKSSPIAETASRNAFAICFDVMWSMRSHLQMAEMGVSLVDPGYDRIRRTMAAAARTGQRVMSPDAIWVVVSFFSSFFCISKVTLRQSAYSSEESLWSMSRPFLKKRRFRRRRISVRRFSCCGTLTYSHERMAKKKARMVSCEIVHCCSVSWRLAISAMT